MNLNTFLNKPFPLMCNVKDRLIVSITFPLFVYMFLLTFQPFGISEIQSGKNILIIGLSIIVLLVLITSLFILPNIFKSFFNRKKWVVKKIIFYISLHFFPLTVLNWIYNFRFAKIYGFYKYDIISIFLMNLAVGILPIIIYFILYDKYYNATVSNAFDNHTNIINKKHGHHEKQVPIPSKNKSHQISLNPDDLICIKSEGNYIGIYYFKNNQIQHELIRTTLSKMTQQLEAYDEFVRCHRSFLINTNKVEKISGSTRNFSIHLTEIDFQIPVSRNFPKEKLQKIIDRTKTNA